MLLCTCPSVWLLFVFGTKLELYWTGLGWTGGLPTKPPFWCNFVRLSPHERVRTAECSRKSTRYRVILRVTAYVRWPFLSATLPCE